MTPAWEARSGPSLGGARVEGCQNKKLHTSQLPEANRTEPMLLKNTGVIFPLHLQSTVAGQELLDRRWPQHEPGADAGADLDLGSHRACTPAAPQTWCAHGSLNKTSGRVKPFGTSAEREHHMPITAEEHHTISIKTVEEIIVPS